MSSYDKVVNEINTEETAPAETSVESTQTIAETTPAEPVNAPADTQVASDNQTLTQVENTQAAKPVDKNSLTDAEKMTYSFRKQLGKQKAKYEQQLAAMEERLKKLETPVEPPKYRDAFKTDDEYINYLTESRVNKLMADREAEMQKKWAEQQRQFEEQQEHNREIEEGINSWFPNEKRAEYQKAVETAFGKGLSDLLEQEKNVLEYLHQTPNSSRILYELATNPKEVENIFGQRNPLFRLMAVRDLENKLVADKEKFMAPVQEQNPNPVISQTPNPVQEPTKIDNLAKPVGKPGSSSETQTDVFSDSKKLRDMLRKI